MSKKKSYMNKTNLIAEGFFSKLIKMVKDRKFLKTIEKDKVLLSGYRKENLLLQDKLDTTLSNVSSLKNDIKELQKLIDEINNEAEKVFEDYSKNPSEISGSAVQINQNSPFLDEELEGNKWKRVIKGGVVDALNVINQNKIIFIFIINTFA